MRPARYWVICEADLDVLLHDWAKDPGHGDPGEDAARVRFKIVNDFLYSTRVREAGAMNEFEAGTTIRRQAE